MLALPLVALAAVWPAGASAITISPTPSAESEFYDRTPTAWDWMQAATPAEINQRLEEGHYRLIDIEVASKDPLRFTAAMVKNAGSQAKTSGWYPSIGASTLRDELANKNLRPIDIERRVTTRGVLYAAVFVKNTGNAAMNWSWLSGQTIPQVASHMSTYNRRIADLDWHSSDGIRLYDVIAVQNSGMFQRAWYWATGRTRQQVEDLVNQHQMRILDLEPRGDGTFDVVLVKSPGDWWWLVGQSNLKVRQTKLGVASDLPHQTGSRPIDIETYRVGLKVRHAVVTLDNSNALTRQLRGYWLPVGRWGAPWGFYLKEVGGPVQAGINQDKIFDPASTIKVVYNAHVAHLVSEGKTTWDTKIPWYTLDTTYPPPTARPDQLAYPTQASQWDNQWGAQQQAYDSSNRSCVKPHNPSAMKVWDTQKRLMGMTLWQSDNRTHDAFWRWYARPGTQFPLAQTLHDLGMRGTRTNRGCIDEGPYNRTTLQDLGLLYERVQADSSYFKGWAKARFYSVMNAVSWLWYGVVWQEAARRRDKPNQLYANDVVELRNAFYRKLFSREKNGSGAHKNWEGRHIGNCDPPGTTYFDPYETPACKKWYSDAGNVAIPSKKPNGGTTYRWFTYGAFIDGVELPCAGGMCPEDMEVTTAWTTQLAEMMRPYIRSAMATWP